MEFQALSSSAECFGTILLEVPSVSSTTKWFRNGILGLEWNSERFSFRETEGIPTELIGINQNFRLFHVL
jgi:hypothetical protein